MASTVTSQSCVKESCAVTLDSIWDNCVADIGEIIMKDKRILMSTTTVDKPGALRFTDSVSVTNTIEKV